MGIYADLQKCLDSGEGAALRSDFSDGVTRRLCGRDETWRFERNEDGSPKLLVEVFAPRPRLIILGGGHIALPLCWLAAKTGFSAVVYDDRPEFAHTGRFPEAARVICDRFDNMTTRLAVTNADYVAIITRGHRYDAHCLRALLQGEEPLYLGMIGSKRRVAVLRETLLSEGAEAARLDRLHAPIGLPIGAATPEEIAVSIVAELIAIRRQGSGGKQVSDCDQDVLHWLADNPEASGAMATVVSVKGSAPRGVGAKMLVLPGGQSIGSIGGGCVEAEIRRQALDIIGSGGQLLHTADLSGTAEEDGMVCGGLMEILIEDMRI